MTYLDICLMSLDKHSTNELDNIGGRKIRKIRPFITNTSFEKIINEIIAFFSV